METRWNSGPVEQRHATSQRPGSGSGANNWLWRPTLSRFLEIGRGPRPVFLTSLCPAPAIWHLPWAVNRGPWALDRLVDYCLDWDKDRRRLHLYYGTDNLAETQQSQQPQQPHITPTAAPVSRQTTVVDGETGGAHWSCPSALKGPGNRPKAVALLQPSYVLVPERKRRNPPGAASITVRAGNLEAPPLGTSVGKSAL